MDPAPVDLDDPDVLGLLIAAEHGVDPTRVAAYRSLARSRGLSLERVLRRRSAASCARLSPSTR